MRSLEVARDDWLHRVVDEVGRLDTALRRVFDGGTAPTTVVDDARDRAAVATLRLDGSPIDDTPGPIPAPPSGTATGPARGGWLEVLRSGTRQLTTVPDEVLLAVEHRGARAGLDALDLADGLRSALPTTLAELHARVTDGLLHPTVSGRARRSDQAVHDASRGRVLFFPVDPSQVAARLDRLATWLADTDADPVVRSGVLHHQLLDIHPYEAGNGRLARIAARLVLAADGLDPQLLGQPEEALLADSIGYLDEVGRARRLGDPTSFVVRWAEALSDGLLAVLRGSDDPPTPTLPSATAAFLAETGTSPFTVVDHRRAVDGGPDADEALALARLAGAARRLPATRGLRWVALG